MMYLYIYFIHISLLPSHPKKRKIIGKLRSLASNLLYVVAQTMVFVCRYSVPTAKVLNQESVGD